MSLWRQLTRGLRVLTNRRAADQDAADEAQHYLEQTTASLVASGLSPGDAQRIAKTELGSMTALREQVRGYGWENVIGALLADIRYAARRLRRDPAFAAVGVITLAVGIGAVTAIFSAVNPILFEPLPYPHGGRIMVIWDHATDGSRLDVTFGNYRELVERNRSFEALAVMKTWQPAMTGPAGPERLDGQNVSAGYFHVLGVSPALGRDFNLSDDRLHAPRVAILTDALWRRRFGGDPAIVGRPITLDDNVYTVVGVMPARFENILAPSTELWSPLQYDASLSNPQSREWGHHLRMAGRLRPGVGTDQARRDLDTIAHAPVREFPRAPWASVKQGFIVNSLQEDIAGPVKPALIAVLGAVMLVLAIACVNVTNLLLARGARRRGELAMRAALGAGRLRMIQQLLTESLLLATLGGGLGMAIAQFGVRALAALSPPGLPRVGAIGIDGAVFAFALGITTLTGLLVGLIPALRASRDDLHTGVRQSSRHTTGGHQFTRRILVVAEVALALMLLVSAGLLVRSLQRLFAVAPGFDASHLLTMQVQTSGHRFNDDRVTHRFFEEALAAVRRVPGVTAAAFTSLLPLSANPYGVYGLRFEPSPNDNPDEDHGAYRYAVSPGYLEAMRIPLYRGRPLDAHDSGGAPIAVLINESLARRKFPGQDPIGQRVHAGPADGPWATIVGVVGDVKQASLASGQADAFYMPAAQGWFADNAMSLVVRAHADAAALAPTVRQAIWAVDKDQPIVQVATMDALLERSAAERRFAAILFEAFGIVALLLAATGIYGILSGSVTERTREIGVRSALGASRTNIVALVVCQGVTLTAFGAAIGMIGAAAATRALTTLLFGISRLDPITYFGVTGLLLGVSLIACWVPAWRAARVDPSITLRAE